MAIFNADVIQLARANNDFRREVVTGDHSQVVLMSIVPGGEIGEEVHDAIDQTLVIVEGAGEAVLEGQTMPVAAGTLTFVPAGTRHNFRNTGGQSLKLYTLYAPPGHEPGTVHTTKADADAAEHHH